MNKKNPFENAYHPPKKILQKYAKVFIRFALNGGKGLKKGEVVYLIVPEAAKPILIPLQQEILAAGGHFLTRYLPSSDQDYNFARVMYEHGSKQQIEFFAEPYYKGLLDQIDHSLFVLADSHMHELDGIDPKKIMSRQKAMKPYADMRRKKEQAGKFSWTLGMYGTPAMAHEAGLTQKAYWNEIIKACFLRDEDPVKTWKTVQKQTNRIKTKLDALRIEKLHLVGKDIDLWVSLSPMSAWKAGSGANIPSFEVFTSPDWRGTNGWVRFNQPLLRYGARIEDIQLTFKNGRVVKSSASKNEKLLKEMIKVKNADKIGEFSLTDRRHSKITKFMAETLFDENVGGRYGNTHVALGSAYRDCYRGDASQVTDKEYEELGYNDSVIHTDIVSTTDRTVTAYLANGKTKIIYQKGEFTV